MKIYMWVFQYFQSETWLQKKHAKVTFKKLCCYKSVAKVSLLQDAKLPNNET